MCRGFLAGWLERLRCLIRILPQLDLTDELAYLSIFTKKHEKD
jgi:hypothetical protein